MSTANTFGFGDGDDKIGKKSKAWKAEAGHVYRASAAWWPMKDGKLDLDAATPRFSGAATHYLQGVGFFINKGPEFTKIAGNPPKDRILTFLVIWPTDKKGQLIKERVFQDFEVVPWVMSGDKYQTLAGHHANFHFGTHDFSMTCTDTQYQKMTFGPVPGNLLRKLMEKEGAKELVAKITGEVEALSEKASEYVGRELTIQQIREKLAGGGGAGGASGGGALNEDAAVSAGAIDSMVDGLLDG